MLRLFFGLLLSFRFRFSVFFLKSSPSLSSWRGAVMNVRRLRIAAAGALNAPGTVYRARPSSLDHRFCFFRVLRMNAPTATTVLLGSLVNVLAPRSRKLRHCGRRRPEKWVSFTDETALLISDFEKEPNGDSANSPLGCRIQREDV